MSTDPGPQTDRPAGAAPGWVAPELLRRMATRLAPVKIASYEALRLVPGARVLDVGCGPATDTLELAQRVGESGAVLGVDSHPQMIAEAVRRAAAAGLGARVEHRLADARDLPFDDGSFDACRSERLFQHLERPETVLAEMLRVTRPGGRVAVVDTDHGATVMDTPESEVLHRLVQAAAQRLPNGLAGRRLYGLLRRAGLAEVEVTVFPVILTDYQEARHLGQFEQAAEGAVEAGAVTRDELDRLRRSLDEAQAADAFFGTSTLVLAAGTRP
ncbi:MAG TPA: methyltransferase domain-containing protein [Thermoanaerobaculia bacterium]|nr:methyltransferase domain-containing protein [Thermoanaerobaculia bacterium]